MSTSSRTCGSSMPAIVSIAPPRLRRAGRLLTLDLLEQRQVESRAGSAAAARSSGSPACPIGSRTPARADAVRDLDLRQQEREPLVVRAARAVRADQSSRLAPTMLTRPPAASRRVAQSVDLGIRSLARERAPQLSGLELRSPTATPSATMPTAMSGQPARRGSLGCPVEGARASIQPAGRAGSSAAAAASASGELATTAGGRVRRIEHQRPLDAERQGERAVRSGLQVRDDEAERHRDVVGAGGQRRSPRIARRSCRNHQPSSSVSSPAVDPPVVELDRQRLGADRRRSSRSGSARRGRAAASGSTAGRDAQGETVVGGGDQRIVAQRRSASWRAHPRVSIAGRDRLTTRIYTL